MRVALLSCGPSVTSYRHQAYDKVIGINRIVSIHQCDYWCCGDAITYERNQPLGRPIICTQANQLYNLHHSGQNVLDKAEAVIEWEWLPLALPDQQSLCFSSCAALMLAHRLGAKRIDVFGVDMVGLLDWDGVQPPESSRSVDRWETERKRWDCLVQWLQGEGVRIYRGLDGLHCT